MKRLFILLLSVLVFVSCNKQPSPQEIFEKVNANISETENMSYSAVFTLKIWMDTEFRSHIGSCEVEKVSSDTLFGYRMRIVETEGYGKGEEHYYALGNIYLIRREIKKAIARAPVRPEGFKSFGIASYYIPDELINGVQYEELIKDSVEIQFLTDSATQNQWAIALRHTDKGKLSDRLEIMWINKENYRLEKISYQFTSDDELYYRSLVISDFRANQKDITESLSVLDIPDDYEVKYYGSPSEEEMEKFNKLLPEGTLAPDFDALDLSGNPVGLSEYKDKVVLLDFWYMACYPCVKAMPHLQELYATYKERGLVVLGLNSADNRKIIKEKIQPFLESRSITYPTLLINREVISKYLVKGYPTLYIINREGKVKYSHVGFEESNLDTLEQVILSELN